MSTPVVRDATEKDAERCREIYGPYVRDTAITFETDVPSITEMASRIAEAQASHAWLVLESDGAVIGYAYGGFFAKRAAYQWAAEVSVYLDSSRRRSGGGRALYEALFERLAGRGIRVLMAGMTVPNAGSEGLHRALGFTPVGSFPGIGWKHGAWHDVAWLQRRLGDATEPPPPLVPLAPHR